ncbi:MAG: hypothetical protein KZQ84_01155 [Candidatus Thiodiazotropha sp. (ex Lucinoma borealis)]|nr:hypothetical protein [Candidatus Thiodiazotropha sp. (ex Lucinoma borealis)]
MQQSVETDLINEPGSVVNFKDGVFVRDMLMTLFAAILTGISGSLLFILLVFGWGSAQAESPRTEWGSAATSIIGRSAAATGSSAQDRCPDRCHWYARFGAC